jgi:hypothetical protein
MTEVEISKTKKTNLQFFREEREKKNKDQNEINNIIN